MTAVDPVGLWPMNDKYGLTDVVGGVNGTASDCDLDSNHPVDLSSLPLTILNELGSGAHKVLQASFTFRGTSSSYVELPNIPLQEDYTYVAFVKINQDRGGPVWHWTSKGRWGDHIWYLSGGKLFYRPTKPAGGNHNFSLVCKCSCM